jgi:hypothetical protein
MTKTHQPSPLATASPTPAADSDFNKASTYPDGNGSIVEMP